MLGPMRYRAMITGCLLSIVAAAAAETVGSYNIRYDNPGDRKTGNSWPQRAPVVAGLIRFHGFDIVGTQEGFRHQIDDLMRLLPEHVCSTHGRDDGAEKGEQIAIFYRKSAYRLLDEGCFWLSETPEKASVGWDADLFRLCGWAKLEPVSGGDPFFFFSVHFDHRGERSRQESARLVLRKIDEIAGESKAYLVGDFNADQTSETYRILSDSKRFVDAYQNAAFRYDLNGTVNRFDPSTHTDSRIDHVFVPEGTVVERLGILTDTYRVPKLPTTETTTSGNFPKEVEFGEGFETRLPSDHFPVLVELGSGS